MSSSQLENAAPRVHSVLTSRAADSADLDEDVQDPSKAGVKACPCPPLIVLGGVYVKPRSAKGVPCPDALVSPSPSDKDADGACGGSLGSLVAAVLVSSVPGS